MLITLNNQKKKISNFKMIKFWFQKRKKKAYIYILSYFINILSYSLDRKLNMFLVHIISSFTFTCV